jgi:archaetidylinositol phosphate synthase
VRRRSDMLLARWERPALHWLAARAPRRVTPDRCTAFGVAGAALAALSFVASGSSPWWLWGAVAGIAAHWLGDSLDGTLARHRRIERPRYGFYLDHVCDAACGWLILVGAGLSPYVTLWVALTILGVFQTMMGLSLIRAVVFEEFPIAYGRIGPTEARLGLIGVAVAAFAVGETAPLRPAGVPLSPYDIPILAIAALMGVLFVRVAVAEARNLQSTDR